MPVLASKPPTAPSSAGSNHSTGRVSVRSKTGCMTCRQRRVKCGEERPICRKCIKSKKFCDYGDNEAFDDSPESASGCEDLSLSALLSDGPLFQDASSKPDDLGENVHLETLGWLKTSQPAAHTRPQSSNTSREGRPHISLVSKPTSEARRPQPNRYHSDPAPQPCVCQQLRQLLSGPACSPDRSRYSVTDISPLPLPLASSELDWMYPSDTRPFRRPLHHPPSTVATTTTPSPMHRHNSLTSMNLDRNAPTAAPLEYMFTPQQLQYLGDIGVNLPWRDTSGRGHWIAEDRGPCDWFGDVDLDI